MYPTHQFKDKFVLFLKIFFPILIYQFANYSASFVDTTMTGQYNTMDLAGVSTATSLWNPFFTFLTGIVSAMVPIIGHHLGRGKKEGKVEETASSESTPSESSSEEHTEGEGTLTVQPGEGEAALAQRAGISIAQLEALNPSHMSSGSWFANPGDVIKTR